MLENLKHQVYKASQNLFESGLVIFTWGNVSAIDRSNGLVVIKPTGISYDEMIPNDMVVVDLDGNIVEGNLTPSTDTLTHLEIYRNFENVGAIVHSHSEYSTAWAQAGRDLPPLGITHANYFNGVVPCTRELAYEEILEDAQAATGRLIVDTFNDRDIDPDKIPGVLVNAHGPFCWGKNTQVALDHAHALEKIAKIALHTQSIKETSPLRREVVNSYHLASR